jgi:hypothetical protein
MYRARGGGKEYNNDVTDRNTKKKKRKEKKRKENRNRELRNHAQDLVTETRNGNSEWG